MKDDPRQTKSPEVLIGKAKKIIVICKRMTGSWLGIAKKGVGREALLAEALIATSFQK